MSDEPIDLEHLRSIWSVAWIVAKRRLERPEPGDLLNPITNISAAIEEIVAELFDIAEGNPF